MKEWLIALAPVIAIGGVYLMIYENRRAEKFRVEQQKIEELAVLASQILFVPTEFKDKEFPYSKINLDALAHMRIISNFYLDGKLSEQVNELQNLVIAIEMYQNDAKYAGRLLQEEKYWNTPQWREKLFEKQSNVMERISNLNKKCLELKTEIYPPKLRTRMKRKIKSIIDKITTTIFKK